MTQSKVSVVRCTLCEELSYENEVGSPLYECGNCGEVFDALVKSDSHRCPSCSKFGSKVSDEACPKCGEAEVEHVLAYEVDDELIEAVEGLDFAAVLVQREAEKKAEEEKKRKAAEGPKSAGMKTLGEVVSGDLIIIDWKKGSTAEVVDQVTRNGDVVTFSLSSSIKMKGGAHEPIRLAEPEEAQ